MVEKRENGSGINAPELIRIGIALVAGLAGAFGFNAAVPPRPDPFTGEQADTLRKEIQLEIRDLCQRVPPEALRRRVIALERHARHEPEGYEPPTLEWGWADCDRYK